MMRAAVVQRTLFILICSFATACGDASNNTDAGEDAAVDAGLGGGTGGTGGWDIPECFGHGDCDDDDVCTSDRCDQGDCFNIAIDLSDGDACTSDTCDPREGMRHIAIDPDDGDACTIESCDPQLGVSYLPVATDDGDACTRDHCKAATGVTHVAIDLDDGDACTVDACDAATGVTHVAIDLDDGDMCTVDSCDSATGVLHALVDMDDGDACTVDSCVSPAGVIEHAFCASNLCDTSEICLDLTTSSVSDMPALSIPSGPAVVSDTIVVRGIGTIIRDVDVRTLITHSRSADLDITVRSPAGTVVTLSTDNGASNDNSFSDTRWDDGANPSGIVPYISNNGMVTDHQYSNLTVAPLLTPEEPLGAFIGEDPNGTWTLTISDDRVSNGGNLAQWGLDITTISAAPTVTEQIFAQRTPMPIVDADVSLSTIFVGADAAGSTLCGLTVYTNITHTFAADMDITLTSPLGTVVTLSSDNGEDYDNVFAGTVWDDKADPTGQVPYTNNDGLVTDHAYADQTVATLLAPEEALSAMLGENVEGAWTLSVSDDTALDSGMLVSWGLTIGRCLR